MKKGYELPCNIAQSLNIIGDRWTLLIIHDILIGHQHFNELRTSLTGISSNLLSERLKHLEEDGLIEATLYSKHPPRYKYSLTKSGQDLEHVFHSLVIWGRKHLHKCYKKIEHTACRHEVEIAYYCPCCKENVEDLTVIPIDVEEKSQSL